MKPLPLNPEIPADALAALDAWIDAHFDDEVAFLQSLVRVPTDTPPGNNAPHAEHTAALLQGFGLGVERYPVPAEQVRAQIQTMVDDLRGKRRGLFR